MFCLLFVRLLASKFQKLYLFDHGENYEENDQFKTQTTSIQITSGTKNLNVYCVEGGDNVKLANVRGPGKKF